MTTVGYGDISPQTNLGRVIGAIVMLVGIGFIALLVGAVAERFVRRDVAELGAELSEIEALDEAIVSEIREARQRLDRLERLIARRG